LRKHELPFPFWGQRDDKMGNQIVDELEPQLIEILKKKDKNITELLDKEEVYLNWGEPELYEHSNIEPIEVSILDSDTDEALGDIKFNFEINWSDDLSFRGWDSLNIVEKSVKIMNYF
jgi:hypothetical protein